MLRASTASERHTALKNAARGISSKTIQNAAWNVGGASTEETARRPGTAASFPTP